jgi:signal transduction histidine kinase
MNKKWHIPIRFKILIAVLFLITVVVSIITFTMANMFHSDKTSYIYDTTSTIALHKSQEVSSLLTGYRERTQIFVNLMYEQDLYQEQKSKLLTQLFEEFQEFITITLHRKNAKPVTIYDAESLDNAGLDVEDLALYRKENPLPVDRIHRDIVFIENSTFTEKLPTLTLAISFKHADSPEPAVVESVIRLDNLIGLAKRSTVFETFVMDSRGNVLVHSDSDKIFPRTRVDWIPEIENFLDKSSLGGTLEYVQNGKQVVGGFAPLDTGKLLVGVQIQKTAAYLTARSLLENLMVVSFVLLIISAILGIFWSTRFTKPIEKLSEAAKVVGTGEFDINVESNNSHDEIGELADSFNKMAYELDTRAKALQDAQSALVQSEKLAAFGQLGAGIAHEVKNPLAGILGFAQLSLRKVDKDNPLHKNLLTIEKETKRCKTIIDNLLKFARQEKVAFELTDINDVVEESIAIMDHQLGIHGVKVEKELAGDLSQIMANGNQIQQILMNFMLNAEQAMNGEPGVITFTTRLLNESSIELRIQDNGPGIPEDIQAKIFDPFFTTKPAGKGTGLGLSVSYGIIKDHKGDIRVESKPGEGTTFIITLPIAGESEQTVQVADEHHMEQVSDAATEQQT